MPKRERRDSLGRRIQRDERLILRAVRQAGLEPETAYLIRHPSRISNHAGRDHFNEFVCMVLPRGERGRIELILTDTFKSRDQRDRFAYAADAELLEPVDTLWADGGECAVSWGGQARIFGIPEIPVYAPTRRLRLRVEGSRCSAVGMVRVSNRHEMAAMLENVRKGLRHGARTRIHQSSDYDFAA